MPQRLVVVARVSLVSLVKPLEEPMGMVVEWDALAEMAMSVGMAVPVRVGQAASPLESCGKERSNRPLTARPPKRSRSRARAEQKVRVEPASTTASTASRCLSCNRREPRPAEAIRRRVELGEQRQPLTWVDAGGVCASNPNAQVCLDGQSTRNSQQTDALISTIGYAAGGAALVTALVWWIVAPRKVVEHHAMIVPQIGPRVAGASFSLSF